MVSITTKTTLKDTSLASSQSGAEGPQEEGERSTRNARKWRNRILPGFADSFQIKASSDGQFEDTIVSQQTMTIAEDILEIEDHLNRVDQRVRVYLPVGRAIVFDQDISIGSSLLPLRLQNLLMSQKLMNVRMAAFNALLIAGAGLFCYGLHDPSSQLGSGGILLAPAALFLAMFYSPTLLRFSLRQFLSNFMFANVTVLWLGVGLAYPRSLSLNIGYLGLIVWGMVFSNRDAILPVYRSQWTAFASFVGFFSFIAIVLMFQSGIAQPQEIFRTIDGFSHDMGLRSSDLAITTAMCQLRIVALKRKSTGSRLAFPRSPMRSILLTRKDLLRLKQISDSLCRLEKKAANGAVSDPHSTSINVVYPVVKPLILLHEDCVLSRMISVRAFRILYRWYTTPRMRFVSVFCLGLGMSLGTIAALFTQFELLAIPGAILISAMWYPYVFLMNVRLLRSMLRTFEVNFILYNLCVVLSWTIIGLKSWYNCIGYAAVAGCCTLSLFSDTLPAKIVNSRARVVLACQSFLAFGTVSLLLVRGSADTLKETVHLPFNFDTQPTQLVLGPMMNCMIFSFKAAFLSLHNMESPWLLRPHMVNANMPLKFFKLFQELINFEPESNSRHSHSSWNVRQSRDSISKENVLQEHPQSASESVPHENSESESASVLEKQLQSASLSVLQERPCARSEQEDDSLEPLAQQQQHQRRG